MSEQPDEQQINPYLTIWTKPRMTIRTIIDRGADRELPLFIFLIGIAFMVAQMASKKVESLPFIGVLLLIVIGSPLLGFMTIYINGFTGWIGGRIFKGTAYKEDIRAAYWWSNVPMIFSGMIMTPLVLMKILYGGPGLYSNPLYALYFGISSFLFFIAFIWSMLIFVRTYQEVQGFSFWRAVAALFVGNLIFVSPFIIIGLLMRL